MFLVFFRVRLSRNSFVYVNQATEVCLSVTFLMALREEDEMKTKEGEG